MDDDNLKIFAANLNRCLAAAGKTQAELCRTLSVSKSTVSGWCQAKRMPSLDTVGLIADCLGVDKADLLYDTYYSQPQAADGAAEQNLITVIIQGKQEAMTPVDRELLERYHKAPLAMQDMIQYLLHSGERRESKPAFWN